VRLSAGVLRRVWAGIGWFGVALLIYLSLTPNPPEIPVEQGDKLGHVMAYAVSMLWWAQLYFARKRWRAAVGLLALGVGLEYVQGWTGYRTFDYVDMATNLVGIAIGWLLAPPRLPSLLALSGRWFGRLQS